MLLFNYDIQAGKAPDGAPHPGAIHMQIHGKVLNDLINDVEAAGGWPFEIQFDEVKEI